MHPSRHAATTPGKPAIIMAGSGETLTYAELDALSNRNARRFRSLGLAPGATVAFCIENTIGFLPLVWAAQRSGLTYVCISTRLTAAEVDLIVRDSGAALVLVGAGVEAAPRLRAVLPTEVGVFSQAAWEEGAALEPSTPLPDETSGAEMLYSSGTTGRPKGIFQPALGKDIAEPDAVTQLAAALFGVSDRTVYFSPAPLYHAAPLRWCISTHRLGGTVVILEKFDADKALAAIARHRATHAQFVPTHFIRMLKLSPSVRLSHDLSSLTCAIHAAAPCSVDVKQRMIDWWGPILVEYYAGTEGNGMTMIGSEDWQAHPGSVGRAMLGTVRICDDEGEELPQGATGQIYFSDGRAFAYHNDPERTAASANRHGWTSLGDVGHVDAEGYLYLTDRKSFMIISGGVNIYPQEIEDLLIQHPGVADVAVIGAPDPDMGERVVAVIQPADWSNAGPEFAADLSAWTRARLSGVKVPRQFDFDPQLPRHDTGKLYKAQVRARYWPD